MKCGMECEEMGVQVRNKKQAMGKELLEKLKGETRREQQKLAIIKTYMTFGI